MGEPITLFGESDERRLERLKLLELSNAERGEKTGINTFFQLQREIQSEIDKATSAALERAKADGEAAGEDAGAAGAGADAGPGADASGATAASGGEDGANRDAAGGVIAPDLPREAFASASEYVIHFFKRLVRLWQAELDARPDDVKRSLLGQRHTARQKETRDSIKVLFQRLRRKEIEADVLSNMERLVQLCQARNYVGVEEKYMTLAIGNAAWPIGVTMVGIHERASRERVAESSVAHGQLGAPVLRDEEQRKYIQAIKRLVTYCNKRFPNLEDLALNMSSVNLDL
jgi:pre-mRNA-splicing factor 18